MKLIIDKDGYQRMVKDLEELQLLSKLLEPDDHGQDLIMAKISDRIYVAAAATLDALEDAKKEAFR